MGPRKTLLDEPYRLFFPLGWIMALVGTSYWLLAALGHPSYSTLYHGLIQIELFSAAFAVGFLLTALPNFFRARKATSREFASLVIGYLLLAAAVLTDKLLISQWMFVILLALLIRFAVVRFVERKALPPYSFLLVAFGLVQGVAGAMLVVYPLSTFPLLGQKFLEQGMLLCLSLGVGSFLGPRLMGVVDTTSAIVSFPGRAPDAPPWFRSPFTVTAAIGFAIFSSFIVEAGFQRDIGIWLRALSAFFCFVYFGVFKIPRNRSIVATFAALSLWMMVFGIFLAALIPHHEVGALHVMYIGGFGLLILTIGAQVISSHGSVHNFWQINRRWGIATAALVLLSMVLRSVASVFQNEYLLLLGLAATLFDMALVMWGLGTLRHLRSGMV